jgi:hypothetical protein
MVMLAWRRPDGLLKGVNLLCQDEFGIKDCYGTDEMAEDRWHSLVGGMDEQGFFSYIVPLEYCRALIVEARQQNKRGRHKLPVAYAVWRPLIESAETRIQVQTMLDPHPYDAETAILAQRGSELYKMPEFDPWLFEPFASLHPYIQQNLTSESLRKATQRPGSRKKKAAISRQPDAVKREAAINDILDKHIDTRWRLLFDTRLRRQAALFHLIDRQEDAMLVSAVASQLHPDSGVPAREQTFLRELVNRSLDRGLVHLMSEMLENAGLKSWATGFGNFPDFPDEN